MRVTAENAALAAVPVRHESGFHAFLLSVLQMNAALAAVPFRHESGFHAFLLSVLQMGAALSAVPVRHESGFHAFYFSVLQIVLGSDLPHLKKALEMFSFGSQTRIISNKHVANYTRKCCKLMEPTVND